MGKPVRPRFVGSTIMNRVSAIRLTERVLGRVKGWNAIHISLEPSGEGTGKPVFLPDYALRGWIHVPFEWRTINGAIEERYVWADDTTWLRREARPLEVAMS